MAVIIILITGPLLGILAGLQWLPKGDGSPPPKPLKTPVAIALALVLGGVFVGVVLWALFGYSGIDNV